MAYGFVTTLRNRRLQAILDEIGTGGKLRIYDGTRPATGGTATVLLAELALSSPAGTISNGVLTFSAITADTAADATGTATWARIVTTANAAVADLSVGTAGQDLNLNTTSITAGVNVSVTSLTITEGNA